MLIRMLVRVTLVTAALIYILPTIAGVHVKGDIWGALAASLVFNLVFWALECLLAVIVLGINIGTLGLGLFITGAVKLVAAALSPSLALMGTAQVLPGYIHIGNYFPGAVSAGLVLGGLLWASLPNKKREAH
ncbi:MAG: phage holin family protein [Candidatus Obscuribacterales bacterium]|nr:phage holin family protein [Candidatus Obscuribacterales bacterium]